MSTSAPRAARHFFLVGADPDAAQPHWWPIIVGSFTNPRTPPHCLGAKDFPLRLYVNLRAGVATKESARAAFARVRVD